LRLWVDTEFYDNGSRIDLISVGAVAETGTMFHLVNSEARLGEVDDWVRDNVVKHLPDRTVFPEQYATRRELGEQLAEFVSEAARLDSGRKPELVFWYGAYDWVALCQLYGGMTKLPGPWPRFYTDLKFIAETLGDPEIPKTRGTAHDALADAIWNMTAHKYLLGYQAGLKFARKAKHAK
jgi:hypothetical protein